MGSAIHTNMQDYMTYDILDAYNTSDKFTASGTYYHSPLHATVMPTHEDKLLAMAEAMPQSTSGAK